MSYDSTRQILRMAAIDCNRNCDAIGRYTHFRSTSIQVWGNSHSSVGFGTNDNGRSATINVFQDPSGAPTILFYFVSWSVGSVNYEEDGFGNIPSSVVQFVASNSVSLNVDLSTVEGF